MRGVRGDVTIDATVLSTGRAVATADCVFASIPTVMSDEDAIFVTVCQSRYSGVYEGAPWLAFEAMPQNLPESWNAGDNAAAAYFKFRASAVGQGLTPSLAYDDLRGRVGLTHEANELGDPIAAEYYPTTIVGSLLALAAGARWTAVALHPQMLRLVTTGPVWSLEMLTPPPFPPGTASTPDRAVSAMLRTRGEAL